VPWVLRGGGGGEWQTGQHAIQRAIKHRIGSRWRGGIAAKTKRLRLVNRCKKGGKTTAAAHSLLISYNLRAARCANFCCSGLPCQIKDQDMLAEFKALDEPLPLIAEAPLAVFHF
jgi:hypothetical protein